VLALASTLTGRLGELVASMDRWVIAPVGAALATTLEACAWILANVDAHIVAAPGDALASRLLRLARGVEPIIGMCVGRVAWVLVTCFGLAAVAHALWASG